MKVSKLSTVMSAGAIAASLAILPVTASAQAQTDTTAPDTSNRTTTTVDTANTNDDFDWGWLGLLGLAGLAGLLPKKRQEPARYTTNEPGVGVHSRSDYR
jgi:hypothetical protein